MEKYNLYAGMSGGFGGLHYHRTEEFNSHEEALHAAYMLAEEEYQSYEGYHGILSREECEEDCRASEWIGDDMTDNEIEDVVDARYQEEIENWIVYEARLASEDPDADEIEEY